MSDLDDRERLIYLVFGAAVMKTTARRVGDALLIAYPPRASRFWIPPVVYIS